MTTFDVPATITAIAAVVTAIGFIVTAILSYLGRRSAADALRAAKESKAAVIEVDGKVFELAKQVDGRLTQLLAARDKEASSAIELAEAKGRAAGEQAQRDRGAPAENGS